MKKHGGSNSGMVRAIILGGMALSILALCGMVLLSKQAAVGAQGSSDAVGNYASATNTPLPVVATNTALPASATDTPAPLGPTSTALPTQAPSATATVAATPVAITVQAAAAVAQGQNQTITVRTGPRVHLIYSLHIGADTVVSGGKAQADDTGRAVLGFRVTVGPGAGAAPLAGTLEIRVSDPGLQGSTIVHFKVFPALKLTIQVSSARRHGVTTLAVKVQLATKARISASLRIRGVSTAAAQAQSVADGKHAVTLLLPLGNPHDGTAAILTVSVVTQNGVHETRTISEILAHH